MIGHDDDIVLDPSVPVQGRGRTARQSRWRGMQSDAALVDAVASNHPDLTVETLTTVDGLLATDAQIVVIISYKTQTSFAWYATFFAALRSLEARGVTVYPSADFKETISSKAKYTRLLQASDLPICPTQIIDRADCVAADGTTLVPALVDARFSAALTSLGLLQAPAGGCAPVPKPFHLVTKPSNADGGFGVAFWENHHRADPSAAATSVAENAPPPSDGENADVQLAAEQQPPPSAHLPLTRTLQMRMMLAAGNSAAAATAAAATAADPEASSALMDYLRDVGFVGERPHLLLQPLVPLLAQHFEMKIYFLKRKPFYAALVYGKEKLMAKVVRPSTDPELFKYLEPLLKESLRALDALPSDGPHDPKILMRVDWGTGAPLLPTGDEGGADDEDDAAVAPVDSSDGVAGGNFLKRALVKRAGSLAAPQKKLKRSMESLDAAPLSGPNRHFINEVEIHPGYYVDWDETPDRTIEPLARAYGEYVTQLLTERRSASA